MIDFEIVNLIVAGFGSVSVLGATEILKRWIRAIFPKLGNWIGYFISFIVSSVFCLYYFLISQGFPGVFVYVGCRNPF